MTVLNILLSVSLVALMIVNQVNITAGLKPAPPPKSAPPPKTPTKPTTPYKCVGPIRQTTGNEQTRIAESDPVDISHYPFMVKLYALLAKPIKLLNGGTKKMVFEFTGVLVHFKWILTSARAQTGFQNSLYEWPSYCNAILVAYPAVDNPNATARYNIEKTVVHPGYVDGSELLKNSLVLLELDRPIDLPGVAPICLPTAPEKNLTGQNAKLIRLVDQRWEVVEVTIVDLNSCQRSYYVQSSFNVTGDKLCAHSAGSGTAIACENEGGALVEKNNGMYELLGLGTHICAPGAAAAPDVYSWISGKVVKWILKVTAGQCGRD